MLEPHLCCCFFGHCEWTVRLEQGVVVVALVRCCCCCCCCGSNKLPLFIVFFYPRFVFNQLDFSTFDELNMSRSTRIRSRIVCINFIIHDYFDDTTELFAAVNVTQTHTHTHAQAIAHTSAAAIFSLALSLSLCCSVWLYFYLNTSTFFKRTTLIQSLVIHRPNIALEKNTAFVRRRWIHECFFFAHWRCDRRAKAEVSR